MKGVAVRMRIRIQNSEQYLDVNLPHPYLLGNPEVFDLQLKQQLQPIIDRDKLKCSGCGKLLVNNSWIGINHRPMSALEVTESIRVQDRNTGEVYSSGKFELKDKWAIFLFCYDTTESCISKWKVKRPK